MGLDDMIDSRVAVAGAAALLAVGSYRDIWRADAGAVDGCCGWLEISMMFDGGSWTIDCSLAEREAGSRRSVTR
jgi:hypothetical protein